MILQKQTTYKGHTKNAKPRKKTHKRLKKITIRWDDVESFQVAQFRFQKASPSNTTMDIPLTQNAGNVLISIAINSFSKRAIFHSRQVQASTLNTT